MNDAPALVITQPLAGYARLRFVTDESDPMAKLIRFDTMTKVASHVEAVTPQGSTRTDTQRLLRRRREFERKPMTAFSWVPVYPLHVHNKARRKRRPLRSRPGQS